MAKRKQNSDAQLLLEAIVNGLFNKKGQQIAIMDFTEFPSAICDYFVVCHGMSNTQVQTLAESVEETVYKQLHIKVSRREGVQTAEWILLDYFNVVVHVFQEEKRNFYKLEQLWDDAPTINPEKFIKIEEKEIQDVKRTKKVKSAKVYKSK